MDMDDIGSANCINSRIASWSFGNGVRAFFWGDMSGESSFWTTEDGLPFATTVIAGKKQRSCSCPL